MTDKTLGLDDIQRLYELTYDLVGCGKNAGTDLSQEYQRINRKLESVRKGYISSLTPWDKVKLARHRNRPTALDLINCIIEDYLELHGDRCLGDDAAVTGGMGWFAGHPVTVIGLQKGCTTTEKLKRNFGMPSPEGYRKSLRLMKQAEKFGRLIICFIDSPGAYPGIRAEERGQAFAIAGILMEMTVLRTPVITVITGEGGGGGTLALGMGDRIFMLEHAVYSVVSPEAAAAVLWKDTAYASHAAEYLKLTAQDLDYFGIIDGIIPEPGLGAHTSPEETAGMIADYLSGPVEELLYIEPDELLKRRYQRFMTIMNYRDRDIDAEADSFAGKQHAI